MNDELSAALGAILASLEGGCEVVDERWGTFVLNPEFHRIHMANLLWLHALPPGGLGEALQRADELFLPYRVPDRTIIAGDEALATQVGPELTRNGFTAKPSYVMVARRPADLTAKRGVQLRPARDQITRDDHDTIAGLLHEEEGYDHEVSHQLLSLQWRRAAALGREVFVAYLGGEAAGVVALDDLGSVGLLPELATAPAMRRRGVAATMVLAMRSRAEERGLALLCLETSAQDTAWQMYERLGFDRVGTLEEFLRVPST